MSVYASFVATSVVLLAASAPFPGAVFVAPLLALLTTAIAFRRIHRLIDVTCLVNAVTPWAAPASLRDQPFFGYLVGFVSLVALVGIVAQRRTRATRRMGER